MSSPGTKLELSPPLSDVLGHIYAIRKPSDAPAELFHLSPSLEMLVVINFGPPLPISFGNAKVGERIIERIGILGPLRQMMSYELQPASDLLVLPFIHDGFYRLLSLSLDKINFNNLTEKDLETHTNKLTQIWEMLRHLPSLEQRVEQLKTYLEKNISQNDKGFIPLLQGIPAIHNPSLNPVNVIADKAAVSDRSIQLRFKRFTGYSPKELLRFLRFKQVVNFILEYRQEKIDWFQLIVDFGYHDQSHLIKDFKYFTGVSPKQFAKIQQQGNFCVNRD